MTQTNAERQAKYRADRLAEGLILLREQVPKERLATIKIIVKHYSECDLTKLRAEVERLEG